MRPLFNAGDYITDYGRVVINSLWLAVICATIVITASVL